MSKELQRLKRHRKRDINYAIMQIRRVLIKNKIPMPSGRQTDLIKYFAEFINVKVSFPSRISTYAWLIEQYDENNPYLVPFNKITKEDRYLPNVDKIYEERKAINKQLTERKTPLKQNKKSSQNNLQSMQELKIEGMLKLRRVKYIREKSFDGLVGLGGQPLRYDFYLPDHNMIIEYDGQHHFKPIYGNETFETTKVHDVLKDKYCRDNNIVLHRFTCTKKVFELIVELP